MARHPESELLPVLEGLGIGFVLFPGTRKQKRLIENVGAVNIEFSKDKLDEFTEKIGRDLKKKNLY
jgi:aryl-alcohol dehydrogenase-like predicted oxidoreductase